MLLRLRLLGLYITNRERCRPEDPISLWGCREIKQEKKTMFMMASTLLDLKFSCIVIFSEEHKLK